MLGTLFLTAAPTRQAAARVEATHTAAHANPARLVRANLRLPLPSDPEAGLRELRRPGKISRGAVTAALAASGASSTRETASRVRPQAAEAHVSPPVAAAIGPGFAKPRSLGPLAQELRAARRPTLAGLSRYAALGKPARSANKATRSSKTARSSRRLDGRISTGGHPTACLPSALKQVLNEVAAKFGPIRINSTIRSHSHNRRVGGAPRSLHLECRAVDFAYHGRKRSTLIKFLRNHDAVGGVGNYGHGGHIHIDDGPQRSW